MKPAYSDYFMLFGVLSMILGALGYFRGKSRASLYAGGISGLLLVGAAFAAAKRAGTSGVNSGYVMGLVVSVLLLGRFLPAFLKSKKFYPAGIMALLAVLGVIAGILALLKAGPLSV